MQSSIQLGLCFINCISFCGCNITIHEEMMAVLILENSTVPSAITTLGKPPLQSLQEYNDIRVALNRNVYDLSTTIL